MKRKIFVVDDHPMMRRGYASLINGESDLVTAGEAGSAAEAMRAMAQDLPDLVIADVSLEGTNGIELVKQLQIQYPDLPVLVISMHDEELYAERALHAGARGYLMKSEADDTVLDAIRRVLDGHFFLSDRMSTQVLLQYTGRKPHSEGEGVLPALQQLSDRELEVFELIGRGLTTREVAGRLHISPKTVESHRSRIKQKLSIDTGNELMRRAIRWVESMEAGQVVE